MKKIVILISGRGSNMQAIVEAAAKQQWPAQIAAVISNRADAGGLEYAASRGIPTAIVVSKQFVTDWRSEKRARFATDGSRILHLPDCSRDHRAELVVYSPR